MTERKVLQEPRFDLGRLLYALTTARPSDPHVGDDTERQVRREQIATVVSLAPMAAAGQSLALFVLVAAFHDRVPPVFLLVWFTAISAPLSLMIISCRRAHDTRPSDVWPTSLREIRIDTALLSVAWGVGIVELMPGAPAFHQVVLQLVLTGLVTAGAFGLSTVPGAAVGWVWTLIGFGLTGTLASGDYSHPMAMTAISALWLLYGLFLVHNVGIHAARFIENERNRIELTDKNEVIALLLNDFQEHGGNWLWQTDADGRIAAPSRRFCQAAGRPREDLSGLPLLEGLLSSAATESVATLAEAMDWYDTFRDFVVDFTVAGEPRSWSLTGRPLFADDGAFVGYRGVASDVTERRAAEARIAHLATTDAITGLVNRARFSLELEDALKSNGEKPARRATLFCIDLDRFKAVNDTMGHPVGDALLTEVGRRLTACVDETWVVARIGGDEFALLRPEHDRPDFAADIANRILDQIDRPFTLDGADFSIGASIGIAIAPDDGATPADLMKSADLALYRAKEEGRDTFRFFEAGMDARADRRRRLEQGLRTALDTDQLRLVYQPIVDLATDRICGFETLIRWTSPEFGVVSPVEFVPIAEECKLIVPIGEWILRSAMREAARWPSDIRVSINLSPVQFRNRRLLAVIVDALAESGLTPNRLQVEITETTLLDACDTTLAMLRDLRALGVRVALDDFGTGYSSLSYLRKFPFDKVKIDKSFVDDIDDLQQSRAIVRAFIELTSALGMTTVAEGVETRAQLAELRALGCDEVQGYVYSPAIEVSAISDFIRADRHLEGAASAA